jgi:hypothetical protein
MSDKIECIRINAHGLVILCPDGTLCRDESGEFVEVFINEEAATRRAQEVRGTVAALQELRVAGSVDCGTF